MNILGESMKKPLNHLLVALFLVVGLSSCQLSEPVNLESAGYNQDEDVYIVFHGAHFQRVTSFLPKALISNVLFDLQEGTHENITDVSGAEIDHYYIWVCLEDFCIPVDPFSYNY